MTTLHEYRTTPACAVESPGYGDLWDQYLVKDITINGPGTLTFSYATDMDIQIADDGSEVPQNGCLFDQLDVYVGLSTVAVPHGSSIPATADISDLVAITDTLIANLRGRSGVRTVTTGAFCDVVTGPITGYPNPNRSFQTGLRQNVPNPFRPAMQTYIAYSVGRKAMASLTIHDISGRLVRTLVSRVWSPGEYAVSWDGTSNGGRKLPGGVYFLRLKVGDSEANRKMLMLE